MSSTPKKSILILLALVMALIPLRYAVGSLVALTADSSIEMAVSMQGCGSIDMTSSDRNLSCPDHDSGGPGTDDCCGDQCGSAAQLLPTAELTLYFPSSPPRFLEGSPDLPEIFLSPEHRPPLGVS